ncbi:MAG: regulatory protein RecX [Anaeroplasma sp.]
MIIDNVKKISQGKYQVVIGNSIYEFDEDVVLKYCLFNNNEVTEEVINNALIENNTMVYYHKALDYLIKYSRTEKQIIEYLACKGLDKNSIDIIIKKLKKVGMINDKNLIKDFVNQYVRKGYGRLLIKEKLYLKGFDKKLINDELENIDEEEYSLALKNIYNKSLKKYDNLFKLKKYLLSRGYLLSEIDSAKDHDA